MSEMSEMVKDNFEFLEQLAAIYRAKGYAVSASLYPEVEGFCGASVYVLDPADDEKKLTLSVHRAILRPGEDTGHVVANRQSLLREAHGQLSLIDFRRGNIIRHIESLREMAQDADLPDDFLNPVMEWAEQLKTTMLPAPSAQHPAPSTPNEEGGRSGLLKLET